MSATYEHVLVSVEAGKIGRISLNRPRALNALNSALMSEVTQALKAFETDPAIRVIVLSAEGRAFSSGLDLRIGREEPYDRSPMARGSESRFQFHHAILGLPKPTISAIQGFCLAGGMELAIACDIAIAGEDALFGEPEVRFGSGIVALIVPWLVGPKHAKDILLTGNDRIPAARAGAIGLVSEVVPQGMHLEPAMKRARDISAAAPLSVELTKRAINRTFDLRGMRASLLAALDTDILIEASGGEERTEFNRIRKDKGLKEAIAWRDARYASA